jgi:hypothetical protein
MEIANLRILVFEFVGYTGFIRDTMEQCMNEIPLVRHFIACEEILIEAVNVTLRNIFHVIRALPGHPYPRIHPRLQLFALLANGRGTHSFAVECYRGVALDEVLIYRSPTFTQDLGNDPIQVHGMPIRLNNLLFPQPGQYEFRLLCNDSVIAD